MFATVVEPWPALMSPFELQIVDIAALLREDTALCEQQALVGEDIDVALFERQDTHRARTGNDLPLALVMAGGAEELPTSASPPGPRIETLPPCCVWIVVERISRLPVDTGAFEPLEPPPRLFAV